MSHIARSKGSELICRELHERLMLRNEQTKQIRLPEVYKEDENGKANVQTWMNSQYIFDAVPKLLPVNHNTFLVPQDDL